METGFIGWLLECPYEFGYISDLNIDINFLAVSSFLRAMVETGKV